MSAGTPKPVLRERALVHGLESLSDSDLLALVLGTGTGGTSALKVATELLEKAGNLSALARLSAYGIAHQRGIGLAKATRVMAALELGRRVHRHATDPPGFTFDSFDAVVRWARPRLAALDHEEVWLLSLDGRNGLKSSRRIAQGGVHACALTPRDVLQPALRDGASALVIVHNHPSGDPTPSGEDLSMTRLLDSACRVVGIDLLDHVVIARRGARSLRDAGAMAG